MTDTTDIDIMIPPERLPEFGITFCNFYRLKLEREGKFPKRCYLSERKPAYRLSEIKEYLDGKVRERDEVPA